MIILTMPAVSFVYRKIKQSMSKKTQRKTLKSYSVL